LAILLARLQGLLRRSNWTRVRGEAVPNQQAEAPSDTFSFEGKTIDFSRLELRVSGSTIQLTLMEADLLRHLIRNNSKVVSRKSILEEVWGLHEDTDTRAIDNFIVRLRKYLEEDPSKPRHLLTVRGVGYRFVAEPEKI
jgi:DNA-binding response OmpR family regulator